MAPQHWLVKSEPESYSWETFVKDGSTAWTGVRSFAARLHLRGMKRGDLVFFYHSGAPKEIVGIARVMREAYADPTAEADEGEWSCVDLAPVKPLKQPVTLAQLKADKGTKDMPLIRQSRLSVMPVMTSQFERVLKLGVTKV
jgi:predicted RNA-binding protein with PUA-like domain